MSNTRPTLKERVIERWGNFENITGSSYVTYHVRAELEALKGRIEEELSIMSCSCCKRAMILIDEQLE